MECRVATTFNWEWGPSTLQRLGRAQALRVSTFASHRSIILFYVSYASSLSYLYLYICSLL